MPTTRRNTTLSNSEPLSGTDVIGAEMENLRHRLNDLRSNNSNTHNKCPVCLTPQDSVISPITLHGNRRHWVCRDCLSRMVEHFGMDTTCPLCRANIMHDGEVVRQAGDALRRWVQPRVPRHVQIERSALPVSPARRPRAGSPWPIRRIEEEDELLLPAGPPPQATFVPLSLGYRRGPLFSPPPPRRQPAFRLAADSGDEDSES